MSRCVLCAQPTFDTDEICRFHLGDAAAGWGTENRIMCDFVHRGIVVPALRERAEALEALVELCNDAVGS